MKGPEVRDRKSEVGKGFETEVGNVRTARLRHTPVL